MKKLLGIVAGLWAGVAFAGDYHLEHTLRCAECHTMHASRSHGLNNETFEADYFNVGVMAAPNRNLLLNDGTNATCLACHDGTANPAAAGIAPDVLGTNSSTLVGAAGTIRSAGALNAAATSGFTAGVGYDHFDGHTIGSDAVPPGFVGVYEPTPQENFNCANCHAVHGSLAFRNLGLSVYMGLPGQSGAAGNPFGAVGPNFNIRNEFVTADKAATDRRAAAASDDVFVVGDARTYDTKAVVFHEGATGGMNQYCGVCHGNFHGDANTRDLIGGIDFVRHPTSGVERDFTQTPILTGADTDFVRPAWAGLGAKPAGNASNFEAACLSCHKGHGNKNGYGLLYPAAAPAVNANIEDGDAAPVGNASANGVFPNLCVTCHAQGREL